MVGLWLLTLRELQALAGQGWSWAYWRLWAVGCTCIDVCACVFAHAGWLLMAASGCTQHSSALPACLPAPPHPPTPQFCTLSSGGDHPFWSTKEAPIYGTEGAFTASGECGVVGRGLWCYRCKGAVAVCGGMVFVWHRGSLYRLR
jgi:hypothetical protein